MSVDQPNSIGTEQLGVVSRFLDQFIVTVPVPHTVRLMLEMIDFSDQRPIGIVKTALAWPILLVRVTQVPLANDRRLISRLSQSLRQQELVGGKAVLSG